MSWGGSGPLGGGPFGGGGGASAGPDPFGGATEFGFSIPQGDPGEIERASGACLARSFALSMQSQNIGTATRAAVAGWEGGAQAAFSGYAGHVAKVIGANAEAFGDAGAAMTALSRDLEHAQRVTRQAAKECASYQNDLTTAQGQATQNASHAQTLRTQAAAAVHPQMVGELNHQAGLAQAAADAATKAADKANGQLQIWQAKGKDADTTYSHQAQESARKIQAAAGRIQTVASLPGGAPVPVTVTPGDVALASSMLGVAGGLPTAAEAMGDPEQLNRLAGGRPITPGTMLSYMNQALAEARKQQAAGKGSLVDAAGGLVHTLTFGAVSFGNSSTPRYRGGEAAGLIPINPDSIIVDGERGIAKLAEGEGSKVAEGEQGGLNLFKWKHPTSTTPDGWQSGDKMLTVPWKGNAKLTWAENSSRLRSEMGLGQPIHETYVTADGSLIPTKGFLNAERNLLTEHGWTYHPDTRSWWPPQQ
jgi:hypothetical protein